MTDRATADDLRDSWELHRQHLGGPGLPPWDKLPRAKRQAWALTTVPFRKRWLLNVSAERRRRAACAPKLRAAPGPKR
jgi:hypothetical protein